jgi:hypothetical protein
MKTLIRAGRRCMIRAAHRRLLDTGFERTRSDRHNPQDGLCSPSIGSIRMDRRAQPIFCCRPGHLESENIHLKH